jgi:hypothetical protein
MFVMDYTSLSMLRLSLVLVGIIMGKPRRSNSEEPCYWKDKQCFL